MAINPEMDNQEIIATAHDKWVNLSEDHEILETKVAEIIRNYTSSDEEQSFHPSWLILGVFGSGKSSLITHIYNKSIESGLLPIYLLAEDLFSKITSSTPDTIRIQLDNFVLSVSHAFESEDLEKMKGFLNIDRKNSGLKNHLSEYLIQNRFNIKKPCKVILLVDELEDQYKPLKERTTTDPLRSWLENKNYLKFLALTPSGIYDIGGADEGRLKKLILPAVSIEYIRSKFSLTPGKANSVWWLSRGIPRHIKKNIQILENVTKEKSVYEIKEVLNNLDRIGKKPGQVNAVEIAYLASDEEIPILIDIQPFPAELNKQPRGFTINKNLNDGRLSDIIKDLFELNDSEKDISLLLAHYFKNVSQSLSDEYMNAYIPENEVNDFVNLALDILLEKEYKNYVLSVKENLAKLFKIQQKISENSNLFLTALASNRIEGIQFSNRLEKKLPLPISTIRKLFPIPISNPVIQSKPEDVIRLVSGTGKPVCIINNDVLFFASFGEFDKYSITTNFKSKVLADGNQIIICLTEDGYIEFEKTSLSATTPNIQFICGLVKTQKIVVIKIPQSIAFFLLSLHGYGKNFDIPYDFNEIESEVIKSDDLLVQKKFEIYYSSLIEIIKENRQTLPIKIFDDGELPAEDIWGQGILNEEIAIAALALIFNETSDADLKSMSQIRSLFTTRTRGLLADVKIGGGLPKMADILLPRADPKGNIRNSGHISAFNNFWSKEQSNYLEDIARILTIEEFMLISNLENRKRLLKAFWTFRHDGFTSHDQAEKTQKLSDSVSNLEFINNLTNEALQNFDMEIEFYNDDINIINSLQGLKIFLNISPNGELPRYIYVHYLDALLSRIEPQISIYYKIFEKNSEDFNNLNEFPDKILEDFQNNPEILRFIADKIDINKIKEEIIILEKIAKKVAINQVSRELGSRNDALSDISYQFKKLYEELEKIITILNKNNLYEEIV